MAADSFYGQDWKRQWLEQTFRVAGHGRSVLRFVLCWQCSCSACECWDMLGHDSLLDHVRSLKIFQGSLPFRHHPKQIFMFQLVQGNIFTVLFCWNAQNYSKGF